ncbi:MAG: hypothetical protein M3128_09640, partial [Verrucomicrobiota bacterium]|nr:hypothetical protein [Verrucomicrobiota bacterium]
MVAAGITREKFVWGAHAYSVLVAAFCGDELIESLLAQNTPTNTAGAVRSPEKFGTRLLDVPGSPTSR